jgi:lysophospholipase L1-like esterase
MYLATSNPDLPYRLRPGTTARVGNITVRINSLGLRGAEVAADPSPGRRRILVLGDSVAYGEGLDEGDTLAVRLEGELGMLGQGEAEVLNGAVSGYNTAAELAYLDAVGLALRPQEVILAVSLNDFGPAPVVSASGVLTNEPAQRTRLTALTNHSDFYLLLRWLVTYLQGDHWYQRLARTSAESPATEEAAWAALDRAVAKMHKEFYANPTGPGWERTRQALWQLRDVATAHALTLTVVIFPEKDQVEEPQPNLDPQRQWQALCEEYHLRCLDLWPTFMQVAGQGSLFRDVQHPNAAGMRLAAREVARFLRQ